MYIDRTLTQIINSVGYQFPALLITGPRQVGKTTCLQLSAGSGRGYVTMDDTKERIMAKNEPELFLQRYPGPILIDEIQYAPELLPYIKMAIDSGRKKGEFWLTGSQQFHLMEGVTESLAGRVAILQLLGFSSRELDGHAGLITPFDPANLRPTAGMPLLSLYERIWRGSFPAVAVDDAISRNIFYSSYVQTYIQRDVRALTNIGDELAFMKFLRAVAARTGQMLNLADLARDVSISPNTAKSWLSILKTSGLVYLLEPYHSNLSKRLTKTPKLFFLDTGLAAYLTEWSSARVLEAGAMSGAIFETWVVTELIKSYWHCGRQAPIYYYRDKDNNEIDILINCDGTLFPIEIKKTATPGKNDIRHFAALDHFNLPVGPGTVICMTDKTFPISATCQAIPACGV